MTKFSVEYTVAGGNETVVVEADSKALAGKMCPTGQPIRVNQVSEDEEVTDATAGTESDPTSDDSQQPTAPSSGGTSPDPAAQADQAGSEDQEAVT